MVTLIPSKPPSWWLRVREERDVCWRWNGWNGIIVWSKHPGTQAWVSSLLVPIVEKRKDCVDGSISTCDSGKRWSVCYKPFHTAMTWDSWDSDLGPSENMRGMKDDGVWIHLQFIVLCIVDRIIGMQAVESVELGWKFEVTLLMSEACIINVSCCY